MKYEDFPNRCVKCNRADVPLIKFRTAFSFLESSSTSSIFSRSFRRREEWSTYSIAFPVCRKCKNKFRRYQVFRLIKNLLYFINIFTPIITINLVFFNPKVGFPFNISPLIFSVGLTVTLVLIYKYHPHRIRNYIEIDKGGRVLIKNPSYEEEIYKHKMVKDLENKYEINKVPCPKCGSLIRKDVDFCNSCGKDLRIH